MRELKRAGGWGAVSVITLRKSGSDQYAQDGEVPSHPDTDKKSLNNSLGKEIAQLP